MPMEISLDIFLSIEEIDDILLLLRNFRRWKISSILCRSISKMSMEMRISKSESNLQGFQSNMSGDKFTENEQFLIKRFTSGKNIGVFDNTMG